MANQTNKSRLSSVPFETATALISVFVISINLLMYFFNLSFTGGFIGDYIAYQVPELFSASVVTGVIFHMNIKHLFLNITVFYFLGILIEQELGSRFLIFLTLILSLSSTVSHTLIDIFVVSIPHYTVAGMSGIAYGFVGFFAFYDLDGDLDILSKVFLFILLAIAMYPILTVIQEGLFSSGVTNLGHLVGSIVGSSIAVLKRWF